MNTISKSLFFHILLFIATMTYSQTCETEYLQPADNLFLKKKYKEAIEYYESYLICKPNAEGIKKKIAECDSLLQLCKSCLQRGDELFFAQKYKDAKEYYLYYKEKCNPMAVGIDKTIAEIDKLLSKPILQVSKENLSFPSSGGSESITVTTNASSYSVDALPSWCSVTAKYQGSFVIACRANSGTKTRTDYFMITAGAGYEPIRINVSQAGSPPKQTPPVQFTLGVGNGIVQGKAIGGYGKLKINFDDKSGTSIIGGFGSHDGRRFNHWSAGAMMHFFDWLFVSGHYGTVTAKEIPFSADRDGNFTLQGEKMLYGVSMLGGYDNHFEGWFHVFAGAGVSVYSDKKRKFLPAWNVGIGINF